MPKFLLSYAYDVPYYLDFTVEAPTAKAAEAIAQTYLDEGKLNDLSGEAQASHEDARNDRVFLMNGNQPATHPEFYSTIEEMKAAQEEAIAAANTSRTT